MLALKWSDVSFERKTISISKTLVLVQNRSAKAGYETIVQESTKTTSSTRIIEIENIALGALQELYKITGHFEHVMSTDKGTIMNARNVDRMLESILSKCGLDKGSLHTLRHTYGSMLIRKGVNIKIVSEQLGHKDVAFTMNTYIHVTPEQKREAIERLE